MLKSICKRINWEVNQACDYIEHAFKVKTEAQSLAACYVQLSSDELEHARKLMQEIELMHDKLTESEKHIWGWLKQEFVDKIATIKLKHSMFRSYE